MDGWMMSCCQAVLSKSKAVYQAIKNIAVGNVLAQVSSPNEMEEKRLAVCRTCDHLTWYDWAGYMGWVGKNARKIAVNIDNLTVLPELEVKEYRIGAEMFCSICKCRLVAKAKLKDQNCPLNRWE